MDIINNETPDPNLIPLIIDDAHLVRTGFKELYNELLDTTIYNCYLDTATNELVFQRDKSNLRFDFSLSGLADVNISNASAGQVLTYSGSDWVAQDVNSVLSFTGPQSSRFPDITSVSSITDALSKILYPYQPPSFSSFSISGKASQFELGQYFSSSSGGTETFNWGVNLIQNISTTVGYTIQDISTPQTLITNLLPNTTNSSVLNVSPIRYTTPSTHTFRITGRNTNGANFTRDVNFSWFAKTYYGVSAVDTPLTSSQILGLSNSYFSSNLTMNINVNGGGFYIWIAAPVSQGAILNSDFSNSRFVIGGLTNSAWYRYTVNHTNASGYTQPYYLYRTTTVQFGTSINIKVV